MEMTKLLRRAVKELAYAVRMATVRKEASLPYLQQALRKAQADLELAERK